ncbi:MAG: hypothetical protein DWP95_02270 [Proteobacteria bacterium]|nr:MAG: hypothetical protein DWP95_02270 [Pseudomonadota bacterium]
MTKPQIPLQLQVPDSVTFADFMAHDEVVASLQNFSELAGFCYLWGPSKSGKSHLLSAYSHHRQHQGEAGVLFSAKVLLDTDISDVLQPQWSFILLDDVQLTAGHNLGERHLFNAFNSCRANRIPLLVASQISPRNTQWQLPDLRSRLQSGLTLELAVLKGNQAMMLLKRQFKHYGIPTDEAVIRYIAGHHATDYTSLDTLLKKLSALSLRDKRKLTVPFVKHVIAEK